MTEIVTPYAAHKLVNAALEKAGLSKRIPPQMMYNYTQQRVNAGKAPFIKFSIEDGVDVESLNEWIEKYVAKQLAKAPVVVADPEQAEFDMAEAN
jgi:hypothetical protein